MLSVCGGVWIRSQLRANLAHPLWSIPVPEPLPPGCPPGLFPFLEFPSRFRYLQRAFPSPLWSHSPTLLAGRLWALPVPPIRGIWPSGVPWARGGLVAFGDMDGHRAVVHSVGSPPPSSSVPHPTPSPIPFGADGVPIPPCSAPGLRPLLPQCRPTDVPFSAPTTNPISSTTLRASCSTHPYAKGFFGGWDVTETAETLLLCWRNPRWAPPSHQCPPQEGGRHSWVLS